MYVISKFYVLAENVNQARYYFQSRNIKYDSRKVINNDMCMRGIQGVLILTGTYYYRRDLSYLLDVAQMLRLKVVYDD